MLITWSNILDRELYYKALVIIALNFVIGVTVVYKNCWKQNESHFSIYVEALLWFHRHDVDEPNVLNCVVAFAPPRRMVCRSSSVTSKPRNWPDRHATWVASAVEEDLVQCVGRSNLCRVLQLQLQLSGDQTNDESHTNHCLNAFKRCFVAGKAGREAVPILSILTSRKIFI